MSAVPPYLRRTNNGYAFWCPGCKEAHFVSVGVDGRPCWTYNEDPKAPTFSPSVLVTCGHYMAEHKSKKCWCTWNAEHPDDPTDFKCFRCHTFVTLGRIQFLSDCSHELANKTVDMVPFPGTDET